MVRIQNSSAARSSYGLAPASPSISAPLGIAFQLSCSSGDAGMIPCRSGSGSRPSRGMIPPSACMSAWIAFSAAFPYMPECRSRAPVFTVMSKATSPRVPVQNCGTSRRSIPPSKITHTSAPRSSAFTQSTIDMPPISSSPSEATRMFTGSAPSSARSTAARKIE